MKHSSTPVTRLPLAGFCSALIALGILPTGAVFAAVPLLPGVLRVSAAPALIAALRPHAARLGQGFAWSNDPQTCIPVCAMKLRPTSPLPLASPFRSSRRGVSIAPAQRKTWPQRCSSSMPFRL